MLETLVKSVASVIAPVAQGVVESVGGPQINSVISKLKEHFSGNDILEQAIEKSYQRALDTVEVALIGPKFYEKASTKNFAAEFWQHTMTPFIESNHLEQEEFIRYCIADIELFKKNKIFRLNHFPSDILAEEVARYSSQKQQEIITLQDYAKNEFVYTLRSITVAPHSMASLLAFRNVIMQSASLHFGQLIQKDEFLFRAFFMVNQAGLKNQLHMIHEQLEQAKQQKNQEMVVLLQKQQDNATIIQKQIQSGLKHVNQEIANLFSQAHQQTLEQLGTITENLSELQQQGKETIQRLCRIEDQISSGHNVILQELRKLQNEIQELRSQHNDNAPQENKQNQTVIPSTPNLSSEKAKPVISFAKKAKPSEASTTVLSSVNNQQILADLPLQVKPVISYLKPEETNDSTNTVEPHKQQKITSKPVITFVKPQIDIEQEHVHIHENSKSEHSVTKPVITYSKNFQQQTPSINVNNEATKEVTIKKTTKPLLSFDPRRKK